MKFEDKSDKVKTQLNQAAERTLTKVGILIKSEAKMRTPVDTGELRDSINHLVVKEGKDSIVAIGTNVEHAYYVEFGTGEFAEKGNGRKGGWVYTDPSGETHFTLGQKPKKFLRSAFRENKSDVIEMIKTELGRNFNG